MRKLGADARGRGRPCKTQGDPSKFRLEKDLAQDGDA